MFYVYITANHRDGILYVGHTDDLARRMEEHREFVFSGFSATHKCTKLVWFELHESRDSAFKREHQIKEWKRGWKIRRIVKLNSAWDDLYPFKSEECLYDVRRTFNPDIL